MTEVLFVDVDDTLVKWCPAGCEHATHPYGWESDGWEPNQAVIDFARSWRDARPKGLVIVWSGGGVQYAETWKKRLMDWADGHLAKGPVDYPLESCTFIDDNPEPAWRHRAIHPGIVELREEAVTE